MLPNGVRCCGRGLPIEPAPPPKSGEGRRGVGRGVRPRPQHTLVIRGAQVGEPVAAS
jgi:hypothetical protein